MIRMTGIKEPGSGSMEHIKSKQNLSICHKFNETLKK